MHAIVQWRDNVKLDKTEWNDHDVNEWKSGEKFN